MLRAMPDDAGPGVWVRSGQVRGSEFTRTGLQRVGHCTDLSFSSGIWVVGRGHVARSDSEESGEARGLQAWEGQVHGNVIQYLS